jgi:hypothetical protein
MPIHTVLTPYGYRSELIDPYDDAEHQAWFARIKRIADRPGFYGQLIDLRATTPDPSAQDGISDAMAYVRAHGLLRSAVVVAHPTAALTVKQAAWRTGVYEWERYFDASTDPDWEQHAEDWIIRRIDPGR